MKKTILLLLVAFSLLGLGGCSKDNPFRPASTPDQLPPATTVGANTVGCLVNGEVFLPHQNNIFNGSPVTCYYQFLNGGYQFGLGVSNDEKSPLRDISIHTNKLQFVEGQTYNLTINQPSNSAYAYFIIGGGLYDGYRTDLQNVGQIKITKLDETNAIISGTFWFNAVKTSTGEIIHITEGRFDLEYTP